MRLPVEESSTEYYHSGHRFHINESHQLQESIGVGISNH